MKKKKIITPFYVIIEDVNAKEFKKYDVMPYFVDCYDKVRRNGRPKTFDEFKEFVKSKSMYMYWSRCEYEVVISSLIGFAEEKKIDVHYQVMNNIDLVTRLLMESVGKKTSIK